MIKPINTRSAQLAIITRHAPRCPVQREAIARAVEDRRIADAQGEASDA